MLSIGSAAGYTNHQILINMSDIELKMIIVEIVGYTLPQSSLNKIFQWLSDAPCHEDLQIRIWCIKNAEKYKQLYNWVTQ